MISTARGNAASYRSAKRLALFGTALASTLALPAQAENIAYNGPGDYSLTRSDTVSGGPRVIDIATSSGNINLNLAGISETNASATTLGVGIAGSTSGNGTVTVTSGSVTTAGTPAYGIDARTTTGAIRIDSATLTNGGAAPTNTNRANRGISATSSSGDITINSGTIGVTNVGFGIVAQTTGGAVTVNADSTTARGVSALLVSGRSVKIVAGLASSSGVDAATGFSADNGTDAVTISARAGAGGVNVKALQTVAGTERSGIYAFSAGGAVNIDIGSVTTSSLNTYAVRGEATAGGNVSIKSQSVITSGPYNSEGIEARAVLGGAVTIDSGTINVRGDAGDAMSLSTVSGAITVSSAAILTGGFSSDGIEASSNTGAISITSGTITTAGQSSNGMRISTGGAIKVVSDTIKTSGGGVSGILINGGGRNGTDVTSNSVVGTGDGSTGIQIRSGGAIRLTSTSITESGLQSGGVSAFSTSGGVVINSGSVSTTGTDGIAILANASGAGGDLTLTSASAIATKGYAIAVGADGVANVNSTLASSGGDGNVAIGIFARGNIALTAADTSSTGSSVVRRADAIYAESTQGTVTANIQSVKATGASSDAIQVFALGQSGAATLNVSGAASALQGRGAFIESAGAVAVSVGPAAMVSGGIAGLDLTGPNNTIANLGSISSSAGPAILTSGATTLDNGGTITGGTGAVAVQLGTANDSVTLRTGSAVTGAIVGGGGADAATLAGTVGTATASQTVARFSGFSTLNVASGYWTATAANSSAFNSATVASGATLELANGGAGLGVTAPSLVDNGALVVRSTAAGTGSTFGATAVTGTGTVLLTGAGTVTLDGTNSLANSGAITVDSGVTALVTGTQGGAFVTNAGGTLQIGSGGTAGTFTGSLADNGTLVLARSDDFTFAGALTGAGTITKQGAGKVTFGTGYAFTGVTNILGGSIKLSTAVAANSELDVEGSGQLDLSGTQQTVAELAGASTAASINIAGGSLTVNQATNTTFAGALVGAGGAFTKSGAGSLNLTGVNTYTGPTTVNGGRLAVNGSLTSVVTVNSGGRLGGTGAIGGAVIASGGTYAPGNSIGTQTVNGNVSFAAGSTYEVEANADGRADRITATGTATLAGGTVQVLAEAGTFSPITTYTILSAAGGVTGTFANATTNFAFLSPFLGYTANAVTLSLVRNDVGFATVAVTRNQVAVANAAAARGFGNPIYNAILLQTVLGGAGALDALGGELFSTVPTVLIDEGRRVRNAVLDRASAGGDGLGVWGTGLLNRAESNGGGGVAASNTDRKGVISGIDFGRDGFRFGAAGGYIESDIDLGGRASHADVKSKLVSVYGGWVGGRLTAQAGGSYTWHDVDTTRTIAVTGLAGTERASFDATSAQGFAELSYKLTDGPFIMAPFIGYAHVRTKTDSVTEGGTAAALAIASSTRDTDFASAGLKIWGSAPISTTATLLPKMSISYQRAWGDLDGATSATFGDTGAAFGVTGARLGRSTLDVDGGFDIAVGAFRIGAGAYASTSSQWSDYGAKASIGFTF